MPDIIPYNPLAKLNLARSIEIEILKSPAVPLAKLGKIVGAGVYVIYYSGAFSAYTSISGASIPDSQRRPIYVGKAIPAGGRKGGISDDSAANGNALGSRLRDHLKSINESENLDASDFTVRHLVIDDIWIPLGENMLIETFKPVWNIALDGFGNKTPGRRRATQHKSPWDVVHPGREFAKMLADPPVEADFLIRRVLDFFAGRPMERLPKELLQAKQAEVD